MEKLIEFLKSLPDINSTNSTKLFTHLLSSVVGGIVALCIAFTLVWDVTRDGKIDTDLVGLSAFIIADSSLVLASSTGIKVPSSTADKEEESKT